MSPEDAEALIMRARVAAGWIEAPPEPEEEYIEEELSEEDTVFAAQPQEV